ncbi:hypothetical protein SD70_11415 [Gordoniibacillus kamchatkensis]|uniref:HAMP domain-containing protein n=2 Tax=Gordoniibacillus kamchatkensis TaxID=1590651 RepID=A0ABR5AIE6_9BACL|nr:hypothetical protein SD70_11415 [Paenibacillus sp. VKM B-2647]
MPLWQFRRDLNVLTGSIGSLLQADRSRMHETIPVTSRDELGQLTGAFNELQASVYREYDELDKRMRLAYNIQQKLLPQKEPAVEGLEVASMCRQCREVGGDFYDCLAFGSSRLAIAIGDVTGKGMPAALLMSAVMVLWRTEMLKGGSSEEVMTRVNRSLYETLQGELFVTMGLAVFDMKERTVDYASAGHMAPYLLREGELQALPVSSLPLGMDPDRQYRGTAYALQPGDAWVLYTDGIIEAWDEQDRMFGFERWEQLLRGLDGTVPLERQLRILTDRLPEMHADSSGDDRTVVCVRFHGREEAVCKETVSGDRYNVDNVKTW